MLPIAVCTLACALGGCDIVEPAEPSGTTTTGGAATAPPRTVSTVCNRSPSVLGAAPYQVNGAFCFGVSQGSSDALTCLQRSATQSECVDELANVAYVVRWAGNDGSVFSYDGTQALGTLRVAGPSTFEVSVVPNPTVAARAIGLCSMTVEGSISVAKYCPYTN